MKHALIVLLASATAASAQVQYAFTNLAGRPGGRGNVDGTGSSARFYSPFGVAMDGAGNVYVADTENQMIRKITPAGAVTTLAGDGHEGSADGTRSAARFNDPVGLAVDSSGNVYVADYWNVTIRKVTPAGAVTTLAGSDHQSGSADGAGNEARFATPLGVAVDGGGNIYVVDSLNATVRKITPAGEVTSLAGSAGQGGSTDGTTSEARFSGPRGVAVDSAGNVYVADSGNYTIRKITPAGLVTTLAGSAGQSGSADGTGSAARFVSPGGVAVDSAGNLYVADSLNNRITKGTPLYFQFEMSTSSPTVSSGFFLMRLTGPSGTNVVLDASTDLQAWTPVQTNALLSGALDLMVPLAANQNQFFRARPAP